MNLKGREIFGGTEPEALAKLVRNGFATWIDTDAKDARGVAVQGAVVSSAPVESVYATAADFENVHRFVGVARPSKIISRTADEAVVRYRQGVGLSLLFLGLEEVFRFGLHPPLAITCEQYVEGSFTQACFEVQLFPLESGETLLVLGFLFDFEALGRLAQLFFRHQVELEIAAAANSVLVPLLAIAREAEQRSGHRARLMTPPPALHEALKEGSLAPAVRHGYITVGRFASGGGILDVASAARIGAKLEEVWHVAENPSRLHKVLKVVTGGSLKKKQGQFIESELKYRVRFGPLTKRYRFRRRARLDEHSSIQAVEASLNGHAARQADYLFEDGDSTIYCHLYYSDIKTDWLSKIFLKGHPEFECVICAYPPFLVVRGTRLLLGPPRS